MGELAISGDRTPATNEKLPKPVLLPGGLLLGRVSGVAVDANDFFDNTVLMKLTAQNTRTSFRNRVFTDRVETRLADIVRSVLALTHADLYDAGDIQAVHHMHAILDSFDITEIDIKGDRGVIEAIEGTIEDFADTDLMRGMSAFSEAEQERYVGMYNQTLIRPAMRLAAWIITIEQNPNYID